MTSLNESQLLICFSVINIRVFCLSTSKKKAEDTKIIIKEITEKVKDKAFNSLTFNIFSVPSVV